MPYALIHMTDAARAAQYAVVAEQHRLSATQVRTIDDALFHVRRLGPAALLVIEVRREDGGFALLRKLRKARQEAAAIVISPSWEVRNEALSLAKALHIAQVLTTSQPMSTVTRAFARALQAGGAVALEAPRPAALVEKEARLQSVALLEAGIVPFLAQAARRFSASMALAWIDGIGGSKLHGYFGWEEGVVPMVGTHDDWAPFRRLAANAPVEVRDARGDTVLSRSALVLSGMVGSFAGAPLVDRSGQAGGAVWIAHENPGGLPADVLEPLSVWAQQIGAALDESGAVLQESLPPPPAPRARRVQASTVDFGLTNQLALDGLTTGIVVTDPDDRIAISNPAALRALGLRSRRLNGLQRARVIERLRLQSEVPSRIAARLLAPLQDPVELEFEARHRGTRHVIAWKMRPFPVGPKACRIDELTDVTREVRESNAIAELVRVDGLTFFGNPRAFQDALWNEVSRALRFKTPLSLALFRIDGRELLEEKTAALVLRDVAWLIAGMTRGYDRFARLDEQTLAVILPVADAAATLHLATRIVEAVNDLSVRNVPRVTVSGGIAQFDPTEDISVFVARARAAVLEAEQLGGNGVL